MRVLIHEIASGRLSSIHVAWIETFEILAINHVSGVGTEDIRKVVSRANQV